MGEEGGAAGIRTWTAATGGGGGGRGGDRANVRRGRSVRFWVVVVVAVWGVHGFWQGAQPSTVPGQWESRLSSAAIAVAAAAAAAA